DLGPIELIPGVGYAASLTSGSGFGNHGAAIWIDYNDDGIFSDDERVAAIGSQIPADATVDFPEFVTGNDVGEHRLRVQYTYAQNGADLDPCNITHPYSETEDYTVSVLDIDCFPPINVQINYITDITAQVSWDSDPSNISWVVIYGHEGFDPESEGESVSVEGDPVVTLTELDNDTAYDVYVKSLCSEDEESPLVGPWTFTTNITPPENTYLCDAIALAINAGCSGGPYSNVAAFEEENEPVGSCLNGFHGTNSVWFTFVAPENGEATVTTDFSQTEFNTEIVVFEAPTDCEDMTTLGEEVGCANGSTDAGVTMDNLTPGDTYYVRVSGFNNADGLFCIEVQGDADVDEYAFDGFTYYPNPVEGQLNLQADQQIEAVTVYNML